jgi:hypothetical protein
MSKAEIFYCVGVAVGWVSVYIGGHLNKLLYPRAKS